MDEPCRMPNTRVPRAIGQQTSAVCELYQFLCAAINERNANRLLAKIDDVQRLLADPLIAPSALIAVDLLLDLWIQQSASNDDSTENVESALRRCCDTLVELSKKHTHSERLQKALLSWSLGSLSLLTQKMLQTRLAQETVATGQIVANCAVCDVARASGQSMLKTNKQQAIETVLQHVRYPLALASLLADFGTQLTTVDSCNKLLDSAVQLMRLFHNDFVAQVTTLSAEQNTAMLQRLDSLVLTVSALLRGASRTSDEGIREAIAAMIVKGLALGARQTYDGQAPQDDALLNLAFIFKLALVAPDSVDVIAQEIAPRVSVQNGIIAASQISALHPLFLLSTIEQSFKSAILTLFDSISPKGICVLFPRIVAALVEPLPAQLRQNSTTLQFASQQKEIIHEIVMILLDAMTDYVNTREGASPCVDLDLLQSSREGMYTPTASAIALLAEHLLPQRQQYIEMMLRRGHGTESDAARVLALRLLVLTGMSHGEEVAAEIATRILLHAHTDDQLLTYATFVRTLRPWQASLPVRIMHNICDASLMSALVEEFSKSYEQKPQALYALLLDNLTRLMQWERRAAEGGGAQGKLPLNMISTLTFLGLRASCEQHYAQFMRSMLNLVLERFDKAEEEKISPILTTAVVLLLKDNTPERCAVEVSTMVSLFLSLADLLWHCITDDEHNQIVVLKLSQYIVQLLNWYSWESAADDLLCMQMFDRLLEKALQADSPLKTQAAIKNPTKEQSKSLLSQLQEIFDKEMEESKAKIDAEQKSTQSRLTTKATQLVHTGTLRRTRPLHHEQRNAESDEAPGVSRRRQLLLMALSAVCGVCSLGGNANAIDDKIVQKRTRCLTICMQRQLIGDNPALLRTNWHRASAERDVAFAQFVAVTANVRVHEHLFEPLLELICEYCPTAVTPCLLPMAHSELVMYIEHCMQMDTVQNVRLDNDRRNVIERLYYFLFLAKIIPRPLALSSELLRLLPRRDCAMVLSDLYEFLRTYAQSAAITSVDDRGKKEFKFDTNGADVPFNVRQNLLGTWQVVMRNVCEIPTSLVRDIFGQAIDVK